MEERQDRRRKPYSKPEVQRVVLTPEESLVVGCKTTDPGVGPVGENCVAGGCFDEFGS